jgi:tetratricopeptide (TPR) repeat protein
MPYLAQCAPERIPMILVEGAVEDEVERMEALAALAEVSLVKHDPFEDGTPAVTVHRLVQAVARARSEANGTAQKAVERLIARLVATYPEDGYRDPQSWPLCAKLTPHLLARRGTDDASVSELLGRAGSYFHGRAAYSQAAPLLRDTLAMREKALGPEHPDTATSLNNLALLLKAQGDFAGARPLLERALAIHEKALGPANRNTNRTRSNLARLLLMSGQPTEALTLGQAAVAAHDKALGRDHAWTKDSARITADALDALGRTEEAKVLRERYGVTSSDDPKSS